MSNPFKKIVLQYEVPNALKQKVFDDIYRMQFAEDTTQLMVVKHLNTMGDF
ncbi:hypothetical protein K8354_00770 [Polaribacter litorisediminis]|uniref:hypothetical protein n=1 Tax=Polaribacter litorisediminis TaxID=1908341 RepID=UPI001CC16A8B|nr:hypothetical protein [Polaribacter litorisediminis]UAM98393.1 hypothetical protein K8354_00770 [Polaribacter litorisediminis]